MLSSFFDCRTSEASPSMTRHIVHSAHLGGNACLRRARESVFWPGMTTEITNQIAQCEVCRALETKQQKDSIRQHALSPRPWQRVAVDLSSRRQGVSSDNRNFSNFVEADHLRSTTSGAVIKHLKAHFARHGIVISDNDPQYSAEEFVVNSEL